MSSLSQVSRVFCNKIVVVWRIYLGLWARRWAIKRLRNKWRFMSKIFLLLSTGDFFLSRTKFLIFKLGAIKETGTSGPSSSTSVVSAAGMVKSSSLYALLRPLNKIGQCAYAQPDLEILELKFVSAPLSASPSIFLCVIS